MKQELNKKEYPEVKVGDTFYVTQYLSNGTKGKFKALCYGYVPKGKKGTGKIVVKLLEMVEPATVNVSTVIRK